MTPLVATSITIFAIKWYPNITDEVSIKVRNYSTGIYLIHRPILWIVKEVFGISSCFLMFLLTITLSVAICAIIYKTKKEPIYSLIR
jgi:peptidoglycan/LPS O-acetylase OafA/YrhL